MDTSILGGGTKTEQEHIDILVYTPQGEFTELKLMSVCHFHKKLRMLCFDWLVYGTTTGSLSTPAWGVWRVCMAGAPTLSEGS